MVSEINVVIIRFCKHGWYWGAAFRKEDAMHFEASKTLVESWSKALGLGKK